MISYSSTHSLISRTIMPIFYDRRGRPLDISLSSFIFGPGSLRGYPKPKKMPVKVSVSMSASVTWGVWLHFYFSFLVILFTLRRVWKYLNIILAPNLLVRRRLLLKSQHHLLLSHLLIQRPSRLLSPLPNPLLNPLLKPLPNPLPNLLLSLPLSLLPNQRPKLPPILLPGRSFKTPFS